MWSTIKTPAIVLTSTPWREADRRYTALTPDFGKLEFVGRGAQKPKAKIAPHLESLAVVELEIVKGARSTTVIGVERKEAFNRIALTLEHRMLVQSLLALVDKAVKPDFEDPELYNEILRWIRFVDAQSALPTGRNTLLLGGFMLRFLRHLGYDIELSACLSCKDEVMPLAFRWHGGRGGLVCSDCVGKRPQEWFAARSMDEEIVTLMRFARDVDFPQLLRPSLRGDHIESFASCVHDLLAYHLPGYSETPFSAGVLKL